MPPELGPTAVGPLAASLAAWLALHLAIGVFGTWWARRYALRRQLLDQPGERRSHAIATPRGGGLSIVVAGLVALVWLALREPSQTIFLGTVGIGLVLVAGIGWRDDHRPLSPWVRLGVHVLAATLLAVAIHQDSGNLLPALAAFGLALVLVNIWNFMDGIDGLAASQALIAAIGYALIGGPGEATWLALALAAACAGFLPFNFPKARVFLGDVGSGTLGYALAIVVSMLATRAQSSWPGLLLLLLLPLSAFAIDAALTLGARILRRERWWTPHVEHAYQRWARRSGRHLVVTLAYAGWSILAIAMMLAASAQDVAFMMLTVVAWHLLGIGVWIRVRREVRGIAGAHRE
ncbi:MAG: glycosyltransferase family 4 protein [Gammaproteobacteria bacterium]|nr:glycosyltransferase family 4 protein [Gammaproteobacteria bacterium]